MSNLIKASMIRYDEKFRQLDANERADAYQKEFIEEYSRTEALKLTGQTDGAENFGGFVPGIVPAATFDTDPEEMSAFDEETAGNIPAASQSEYDELSERLEELREEADSIIERANDQAQMILETAKAQAESECRSMIESESQRAYAEGMDQAQHEIEELKEQLRQQIEDNSREYEKQVAELEPAFVGLLIGYVSKITGILLEDRRDLLTYVIDSALKEKVRSSECMIRVPGEELQSVLAGKAHFEEILGEGSVVSISEDKLLKKGQCIIETESRIFDCSIENGLAALIEDLKILSQKD